MEKLVYGDVVRGKDQEGMGEIGTGKHQPVCGRIL